jgi:hypothetical protein
MDFFAATRLSALTISPRPTDACSLHGRQPVFPHRRINRRPISPFQAAYDKLDLPCGIAMAPPNGFEEDPHRVIAFNYGDNIGRFHDGHSRVKPVTLASHTSRP